MLPYVSGTQEPVVMGLAQTLAEVRTIAIRDGARPVRETDSVKCSVSEVSLVVPLTEPETDGFVDAGIFSARYVLDPPTHGYFRS